MPLTKLNIFLKLASYWKSLTAEQKLSLLSLGLLIASCWFAFQTNDENKRLLLDKNKENKDYTNLILQCEARIRFSEETHRKVYDAYRDKVELENKQRIKDFEKKYESVQAQQNSINSKVREADQIIERLKIQIK